MTQPMTDERLLEIETLCKSATAGPWSWLDYPNGAKLLTAPSCAVVHMQFPVRLNIQQQDMDLMANAREIIPELVAEIRLVRALLADSICNNKDNDNAE